MEKLEIKYIGSTGVEHPSILDIIDKINEIIDYINSGDIRAKLAKMFPVSEFPPCYAPNGICTNPQMDCINCPKRGTGGYWSTTLKAEGEMFQERFNGKEEQ